MPEPVEASALSGATRDVLETMFFTEVLGETAGHAQAADHPLEARLRFAGTRPGAFRIVIAPRAARTIAANFLGSEEEAWIPDSQVGDVACELANMICGSVLSRLAADVAFDLSHPEIATEASDQSAWPETAARTFDLENGWLTAAIRFEEA